jgi:hypothetical protein
MLTRRSFLSLASAVAASCSVPAFAKLFAKKEAAPLRTVTVHKPYFQVERFVSWLEGGGVSPFAVDEFNEAWVESKDGMRGVKRGDIIRMYREEDGKRVPYPFLDEEFEYMKDDDDAYLWYGVAKEDGQAVANCPCSTDRCEVGECDVAYFATLADAELYRHVVAFSPERVGNWISYPSAHPSAA